MTVGEQIIVLDVGRTNLIYLIIEAAINIDKLISNETADLATVQKIGKILLNSIVIEDTLKIQNQYYCYKNIERSSRKSNK